MKRAMIVQLLAGAVIACLLVLGACTRYDNYNPIYNPGSVTNLTNPSIANVVPAARAIAGVREIVINGDGFSTVTDSTTIYFGGQPAKIKSLSRNALVLYRPPVYGDSINVAVVVKGALGVAKLNGVYAVDRPVFPFDAEDTRTASFSSAFSSMELDPTDQLLVGTHRGIHKFSADPSIPAVKYTLDKSDFNNVTDMKFGPGGLLYIASSTTKIFRFDLAQAVSTSNPATFVTLPKKVDKIDFDENHNIYAGGTKTAFYVVHSDGTIVTTTQFGSDYTVREVRVYNHHVYVAASTTGSGGLPKAAIYSLAINDASGALSDKQIVVNITALAGYTNCDISSFTIDAAGNIIMCLKGDPTYSVFALEPDGSISPYYSDSILPRGIEQIEWGHAQTAYLNRGLSTIVNASDSIRLYRMGMTTAGAPYLGRP